MACSLLQEFFILSCDPVYDSSVYFSVAGEAASIEDQSWFPFLSGNELHD